MIKTGAGKGRCLTLGRAINVLQLGWSGRENHPPPPRPSSTITLALHSWFDFQRVPLGCVIGPREKTQMGKVAFGDLSQHFASEDSQALMFPVVRNAFIFPPPDPVTPRFIC